MNVVRSVTSERVLPQESADPSDVRPPPFTQGFDPLEVLRMLWRRKWVMLWTTSVIMIIAAALIMSLKPLYTATALVEINPRQAQIVDFEAVLSGLPADVATLETEIQVIRSRKLAEKTVEKLGMQRVAEFNPALRPPGLIEDMLSFLSIGNSGDAQAADTQPTTETAGAAPDATAADVTAADEGGIMSWAGSLGDRIGRLLSPQADDNQVPLDQIVASEKARIVDVFLGKVSVSPQGRSRVIAIEFESQHPLLAAQAANVLADFYIVSQLEAKFEAAKRANMWLSDRIGNLRREVDRAERAVEQFREKSGLIQGGTDATLTGEQVSDLNRQYVLERTRLAEARARLRQVENLLNSPKAIETAGEVLNSQIIRDLRLQEAAVERRVAELSNEYGERHPRMISARAELEDVQDKIRSEVTKIVQSLRNEVGVAGARSNALRGSLDQMKGEVARLNASEVQLRALEREAAASRTLLEQLLTRSKETASQEDFQQPDATIITEAAIPKFPSFPKKGALLALALGIAISISILTALAVDRLDYGFRSTDQVERYLGVPPLGLVPSLAGMRSIGTNPYEYVVENPTSAYAEAIRSLYTNLLLVDVEKRPNIVLFSSALPNEGKSSMVVSLGRLLALVGQKVVIVDCDLRRPSIHGAFNVKGGPGVVECLTGERDIAEVIQVDEKTGAHFIRAGSTPNNPTDLLDSLAMQKFLKTLARKYDLVLIDSAPVLAVSDTLFIGRLADKTVFLVKWAKTRRETAQLAIRRMQDAHCDVAGVLLSMVDVKGHAQYSFSDSGSYHGKLSRYYTG